MAFITTYTVSLVSETEQKARNRAKARSQSTELKDTPVIVSENDRVIAVYTNGVEGTSVDDQGTETPPK